MESQFIVTGSWNKTNSCFNELAGQLMAVLNAFVLKILTFSVW